MKIIPILSIIGWSNTGKTTLVGDLIEIYGKLGLKSAALKRTHDQIEMDRRGSDSRSYIERGAFAAGLDFPEGGYFFMPGFIWTDDSLRRIFKGADVIICEGLVLDGYPLIQTAGKASRISELKRTPDEWTAVITDREVLRKELTSFNIKSLKYDEIDQIPDIVNSSQPFQI